MCFTGEMSAAFAALGLFFSWWIDSRTNNRRLACGVFFFFTMEALQAVQYLFISSGLNTPVCASFVNQFLTIAGYLHICLQPYFCHVINESLSQNPNPKFTDAHNRKLEKYHHQYTVVKRLCLIGGFLLFLRWPMAYVPGWNTQYTAGDQIEWIRGDHVCTYKTDVMWHLGWSIPLADSTYNIQGIGLHSFLMFAPFFALYEKKGMIIQGAFLYLTGPALAGLITDNLQEQASIWCFMSIAQISIMLFLIRETLIINFGKDGHKSLASGKSKSEASPEKENGKGKNGKKALSN